MHSETIFTKLTPNNFIQYCDYHYDNPSMIDEKEFHQDLNLCKDIVRLFKRFEGAESCNTKLIVNNIITLSNVFGILPSVRILFYSIDQHYHKYLIYYLNEIQYLSDFNKKFLQKYDGIETHGNFNSDS
jgi:hypothetical protein